MAIKAVQQIMLGTVTGSEAKAKETLQAMVNAGYNGIELNSFMVNPTPFMVRMLTMAAGMPTGKGGNLDWAKLVREAELSVVSLHKDLGGIERETAETVREAEKYNTTNIVITGMYRFDYRDKTQVTDLCKRLNEAGKKLKAEGISLLYHNHNYEFQKVDGRQNAYEYIIANTDPEYVSLLFDTGHFTYCGADPLEMVKKYVSRIKHVHLKDIRPEVVEKVKNENLSFLEGVRLGTFTVPGDGCIDFDPIFKVLEDAGYEGYMLVEAEQDPAKANPLEYAIKARKFIAEKTGL